MFGYVRPLESELKVREYEVYKGYYCGICKTIENMHGQIPRLALTYDSVFLAMLIDNLIGVKPEIDEHRCLLHPLKSRIIIKSTKGQEYAGDMLILLTYFKFLDDTNDEKKIRGYLGKKAFSGKRKAVSKKYINIYDLISKHLDNINMLEKSKCSNIDLISEEFGKIMETLFCPETVIQDQNLMEPIKRIGYMMGKWIYVIDALDDIMRDIKNKSYNPLMYMYNLKNNNELDNIISLKVKPEIKNLLYLYINDMTLAFNLLPEGVHNETLKNILYLGLRKVTDEMTGCLDH